MKTDFEFKDYIYECEFEVDGRKARVYAVTLMECADELVTLSREAAIARGLPVHVWELCATDSDEFEKTMREIDHDSDEVGLRNYLKGMGL